MIGKKRKETLCPLLKKPCIEHDCKFWTGVRGTHPQTGEEIDEEGCAIGWLPVLLIENSQQQRQTGAATESLRNEVAKRLPSISLLDFYGDK